MDKSQGELRRTPKLARIDARAFPLPQRLGLDAGDDLDNDRGKSVLRRKASSFEIVTTCDGLRITREHADLRCSGHTNSRREITSFIVHQNTGLQNRHIPPRERETYCLKDG
jgi:hypothetical protein